MYPSFYVAGCHSLVFSPRGFCTVLFWLRAGDGVACGCAVPFEDEVERVLRVVWCAGAVCFVPVDVVRALINAGDGDGRVPITHGDGGTYGEVVLNVVTVEDHLLAGLFVNENGVLVGVEVVAGADPHFAHLCERGALGRAVGRFGECHTLAVGGDGVDGAVLVDGDGRVFGVVGSADDVGRVGLHVDTHERLVGAVVALLEPNDACALEDAVNPHWCVEKNGGLHECAFFPWRCFLLASLVYHAHAHRVYMCRGSVL